MITKTGITTNIVKRELEASTNNVRELCTHTNINMYAKFKPVKFASAAPDRNADWWKAQDGYCGLIPARVQTLTSANLMSAKWEYAKPTGGAQEPYRLADFGGYNHTGIPFYIVTFPHTIYRNQAIDVLFAENDAENENILSIRDIAKSLNSTELYIGILCEINGYTKIYTSNNILDANMLGNFCVTIKSNLATAAGTGTVKMTLFLSTLPANDATDTLPSSALIYAYPATTGICTQKSVSVMTAPTYVDNFNITEWVSVENVNFNTIKFKCKIRHNTLTNASINVKHLLLSYTIIDEWGNNYNLSNNRYWNSETATYTANSSGDIIIEKTFTMAGITTIRNWGGMFSLTYDNYTTPDALGGFQINYKY